MVEVKSVVMKKNSVYVVIDPGGGAKIKVKMTEIFGNRDMRTFQWLRSGRTTYRESPSTEQLL